MDRKAESRKFLGINTADKEFSLDALLLEFAKACPDYGKKIEINSNSCALSFAKKVLYVVGPDAAKKKKEKKDTSNVKWDFCFENKDINDPTISAMFTVEVNCFEHIYNIFGVNQSPMTIIQPTIVDRKLILTVQQAGLIAVMILSQFIPVLLATNPDSVSLTPLAGAVFRRSDIKEIADKLNTKTEDVFIAIIQSCQTDGHYLPASDGHIASAAVLYTTREINNETRRTDIIHRVMRKYVKRSMTIDNAKLVIYREYARGGNQRM